MSTPSVHEFSQFRLRVLFVLICNVNKEKLPSKGRKK